MNGSVSLVREAYQSVKPVVVGKYRRLFFRNGDYTELPPETAIPKRS